MYVAPFFFALAVCLAVLFTITLVFPIPYLDNLAAVMALGIITIAAICLSLAIPRHWKCGLHSKPNAATDSCELPAYSPRQIPPTYHEVIAQPPPLAINNVNAV